MRRKLIKQDAFDQIEKQSVNVAERELVEAQSILSNVLGKGRLELHCFNESTAVYESASNTYIHASYVIKEGNVTFNNIEELVIDESSRKDKVRNTLSEMIDSLLVDDKAKAQTLFKSYLEMVRWSEGNPKNTVASKVVKEANRYNLVMEACAPAGLEKVYATANNILDYVDFLNNGPAINESLVKRDQKGNVINVRVPTNESKNQSRIKKFNWLVPNHQLHDTRTTVPALVREQKFCESIANLRRQNAFSDQEGLENALDHIAENYPQLMLTTQTELASLIGEALDNLGVDNYDDQHCQFMAEGILRKTIEAYDDKAREILNLSKAPKCEANRDAYEHFQGVVHQFYPELDQRFGLEKKAFSDMYESLNQIYKVGERERNQDITRSAAAFLNEIADILNGEIQPNVKVLQESAAWTKRILESNVEGASDTWNVSNKTHQTVSGDHPQMARNATVPAIPGRYEGDWGDSAPAIGQDNHNYKGSKNSSEMRSNSWGQTGGSDVFPKLSNPYVPKPFGDWTMKGETGVDKDALGQHHSTWSSNDTWPDLQNPYIPQEAGGTGGSGFKMKNGSETDLVVDR